MRLTVAHVQQAVPVPHCCTWRAYAIKCCLLYSATAEANNKQHRNAPATESVAGRQEKVRGRDAARGRREREGGKGLVLLGQCWVVFFFGSRIRQCALT